jgi:endonuclease YncB( thermonuclease family)
MPEFTVISIVDGDTFEVYPLWNWNGQSGSRVRPTGYDAPELCTPMGQVAKKKLSRLILNERVDLRAGHRVDRDRLVCDIYFRGRNLADYFPEYQ